MPERSLCTTSAAETEALGAELARALRPGSVVLVRGELGAGKTTFVKGVARALGVDDRVTSPTFTMVRQYAARNDRGIVTVHHADVYRVTTLAEVRDLDLGELVEEDAVALVEWGDVAASIFGRDVLTVDFVVREDESRVLDVAGALDEARASALEEWVG